MAAHDGRMKKLLTYALPLILLNACATPASQEYINYFGEIYHYSSLCHQAGLIDIDTAAKGRAFASRSVRAEDAVRVNEYVSSFTASRHKANKQVCDGLTLRIKEAEVTQVVKAAQPVYQYRQPRVTNCSTYFGQTTCTSF